MSGPAPRVGPSEPAKYSAGEKEPQSRWPDALNVARLLAVDPIGLGGVAIHAGPGPARDFWLDYFRRLLEPDTPIRRFPPTIEDDRLLGGLDLVATLRSGKPVFQRGVLAEADRGFVIIPTAERLSQGMVARLAHVLDQHELVVERDGLTARLTARIGCIALDEGETDDEALPDALAARLAFHLDLRALGACEFDPDTIGLREIAAARARLAAVEPASDDIIAALVATAVAFGIESITPPLLALRVARVAAAIAARRHIATEDVVLAARLVLAVRARALPVSENEQDDQDGAPAGELLADKLPPDDFPEEASIERPSDEDIPPDDVTALPDLQEMMLAAVQAALPEGLLAALQNNGAMASRNAARRQGSGAAQISLSRGRPAGVRAAAFRPGTRLALVDTLRAAAPWQKMRRDETSARHGRIQVRREDFRIKKFVQRREKTIVFCVDASGSAAFHRLAETKGAVELLLGEAYIARNYAALVAFRGLGAQLLLPPTRSLSRAKALLATLPGGGGTPLAAGIEAALLTAVSERAKGREPLIVVLTDGRANIARDATAARQRAADDARSVAKQLGAQRIAAIFVDTSPRPNQTAVELAAAMHAHYVALPYVQASAVRDVVLAASGAVFQPGR